MAWWVWVLLVCYRFVLLFCCGLCFGRLFGLLIYLWLGGLWLAGFLFLVVRVFSRLLVLVVLVLRG